MTTNVIRNARIADAAALMYPSVLPAAPVRPEPASGMHVAESFFYNVFGNDAFVG
ncbi:hypothetical protein [Variovorax sp. Varisp62]|uniref:hypothetical protein n=1 Tax=Variovorax sp. Varisp62 TaxID=3243049 RepID=UPI0039B4BBD2